MATIKRVETIEGDIAQIKEQMAEDRKNIDEKFVATRLESQEQFAAMEQRMEKILEAIQKSTESAKGTNSVIKNTSGIHHHESSSELFAEQTKGVNKPEQQFDDLGLPYMTKKFSSQTQSDDRGKHTRTDDTFFQPGNGNGSGGGRTNGSDYRMRKLKMPILEGDDAHGWIYRVERYFEIQGITRRERLRAAALCLEGEGLAWYRWYQQQEPFESWNHLKEELLDRFQFTKEGDLYQQLIYHTQPVTTKVSSKPVQNTPHFEQNSRKSYTSSDEVKEELKDMGFKGVHVYGGENPPQTDVILQNLESKHIGIPESENSQDHMNPNWAGVVPSHGERKQQMGGQIFGAELEKLVVGIDLRAFEALNCDPGRVEERRTWNPGITYHQSRRNWNKSWMINNVV